MEKTGSILDQIEFRQHVQEDLDMCVTQALLYIQARNTIMYRDYFGRQRAAGNIDEEKIIKAELRNVIAGIVYGEIRKRISKLMDDVCDARHDVSIKYGQGSDFRVRTFLDALQHQLFELHDLTF